YPPVEILFAFLHVRAFETSDADDAVEFDQYSRHAIGPRLVDARLNAALALACPPFAVEEPRRPCERVPIHPRVKNTSAGVVSVPRPSHVHATGSAISRYRVQSSMSFRPAN